MKHFNKIFIITFALALLLSLHIKEGYTTISPTWQTELCARLNEMKSGRFFDTAHDGALEFQVLALDSSTAIPAILEMFVRDSHNIELFWWKQENRATRCFVMALYLCATSEGVSWIPEFDLYIERFNEKEKQERKEEQTFILEHRSALAGVIAEILQKRDIEKYKSEFEGFFDAVAKAGLGKRLPRWCKDAKE